MIKIHSNYLVSNENTKISILYKISIYCTVSKKSQNTLRSDKCFESWVKKKDSIKKHTKKRCFELKSLFNRNGLNQGDRYLDGIWSSDN